MSYDDDVSDGRGFKTEEEDEETLEPMEDGLNDFRFDEDADNDPDDKYH